jgi:hypothetical protein
MYGSLMARLGMYNLIYLIKQIKLFKINFFF